MTLTPHIPIEKKQTREELLSQYLQWRNNGGVPTVITKETLRTLGMKKAGKWGAHLTGDTRGTRFVLGEKQEPMLFAGVS